MKRALCLLMAFAAVALPPSVAAQDPQDAQEESVPDDIAQESEFEFLTEEEEELAEFEKEMNEAFSIFGELFAPDPLTEEQEALLPLTEQLAGKIMPEGSLAKATDQAIQPIMDVIIEEAVGDSRNRLATLTGMDIEELRELDDEAAQETLDVFDPNFAVRTEKTNQIVLDMISQLLDAMEPAYREALSRALTLRFDESELQALLAFTETPLGAKFARESFLVHYDPQMMGVLDQMGPAMVEVLPALLEAFEEIETDLENVRNFGELSEAERRRVTVLLDKSASELDALQPQTDTEVLQSEEGEAVT